MERLIPASVVKIAVTLVFALLGSSASFTKVLAAAFHFRIVRKRHMRLANRIGVIVILFRVTKKEDVLVVGRWPSLST